MPNPKVTASASVQTDLGLLSVAASERGIVHVDLRTSGVPEPGVAGDASDHELCAAALQQIGEYLAGRRRVFDLPLDISSGTQFQQRVWQAARQIPFGELRTYGQLAALAGNPQAARATGSALGANPVLLLVPCHRVVASGGALGGFTAGLALKRELLRLEGHVLDDDSVTASV